MRRTWSQIESCVPRWVSNHFPISQRTSCCARRLRTLHRTNRSGALRTSLKARRRPNSGSRSGAALDDGRGAPPVDGEETAERGAEQLAAILLEEDDLEGSPGDQAPAGQSVEASGENTVRAREIPGQTPRVSRRQEAAVNALRGGGFPLPAASRAFFEPRFGHDFGRVRIHTGMEAGRMARAFRARAFALGSDVVFGSGQYQPATPAGRWLIAHELTHVLQQQEGEPCVARGRSGKPRPAQSGTGRILRQPVERDQEGRCGGGGRGEVDRGQSMARNQLGRRQRYGKASKPPAGGVGTCSRAERLWLGAMS